MVSNAIDSFSQILDDFFQGEGWERRTPQLMALLTAAAPQLQSLNYIYLGRSPTTTAAAGNFSHQLSVSSVS